MTTFTTFTLLGTEAAAYIPQIAFEKYVLPNGLQVILHEDHSIPIVAVNVWYHVGSKNERPGRTGFAHLFEHMMFQGTKHYDKDYFLPLQEAGGRLNGSTNSDRTNYWETVPANYLELALWLESDRMAFLLPAMTPQRLDNQRSVVKNERRQSYENRPYGLVYETILAALYPPDHPYSWPTIGSMADLDAASLADVADFFRRYYHPGNASLCVAGAFQPEEVKRLVAKYFGPIAPGPKVEKLPPAPAKLDAPRRIKMVDRVGLPRLYMVWPTVPLFAPDDAELEVLGDILGSEKTARLYQRLVREKQLAQDVNAAQLSAELAGAFMIIVTARPNRSLGEIEQAVREEIARLHAEPPTAEEVRRAAARNETQIVRGLESLGGFWGRADRLNMYNIHTGDPGYLAKDIARLRAVEPAGVQRVARGYLGERCVVVEVEPGSETKIAPDPREPAAMARAELAKQVEETPVPEAPYPPEDADRVTLPKPGAEPDFRPPAIRRGKLANGSQLLVWENHELPVVSLHVAFPWGAAADPSDKPGLVNLLVATWDEGTPTRTSLRIAEELANIGASLAFSVDADQLVARLYVLKQYLPQALEIFADVLQHPEFPESEVERERNIMLGRLLQIRNEPVALAGLAEAQIMYGYDHPYGRPAFGTTASLKALRREELLQFYRTRVQPAEATVIAVGDITVGEITAALDKALGNWKGGAPPQEAPFPPTPSPTSTTITLVDKPQAAQSVISLALPAPPRQSPDFYPLVVMNTVLGGQFASRLNMNLREDKGYTYGARSTFEWTVRERGVFTAISSVHTAVTAAALREFFKELAGMRGDRPPKGEELDFCKKYLIRGYPMRFETTRDVATELETLVKYSLPEDYFARYIPRIAAVDEAEVLRVARQYLDLEHLAVIIVGDRAKVEPSLRKLPSGQRLKVMRFDDDFRLVPQE